MAGKKLFEVTNGPLGVRTEPGGTRLKQIGNGVRLEVDVDSRREQGGYVWWRHADGWSAERTADGATVYMQEVAGQTTSTTDTSSAGSSSASAKPETTQPVASSTKTSTVEALKSQIKSRLQAKSGLKTRETASLKGKELADKFIQAGTILDVDPSSLVEVDKFLWIRHAAGWSAYGPADGSDVFLVEPGSVPGVVVITDTGPDVTTLPGYKTLIKRLPVDLAQTVWFQYFGNNEFAYRKGKAFGYDNYSQGLHGGLDLGNNRSGIPIYAGIDCTYLETKNKSPNLQIWTKSGDYTIIYQHIKNARAFTPNQALTPDTVLAEIEPAPGYDHLHFEIRYKGTWIINPLVLMPDEMASSIITKFKPDAAGNPSAQGSPSVLKYFYKDANWTQWITPFDQPSLKLAGPVIGPRAKK